MAHLFVLLLLLRLLLSLLLFLLGLLFVVRTVLRSAVLLLRFSRLLLLLLDALDAGVYAQSNIHKRS